MTEDFPNTWINIRRVGHVFLVILTKPQNQLIDDFVGGIPSDELSKRE